MTALSVPFFLPLLQGRPPAGGAGAGGGSQGSAWCGAESRGGAGQCRAYSAGVQVVPPSHHPPLQEPGLPAFRREVAGGGSAVPSGQAGARRESLPTGGVASGGGARPAPAQLGPSGCGGAAPPGAAQLPPGAVAEGGGGTPRLLLLPPRCGELCSGWTLTTRRPDLV